VRDATTAFRPPAPKPRERQLGPVALLRVLKNNPLEAWTAAHFEQPVVVGGLSIGRVAVISDPNTIRHVLVENFGNYQKDWLQRRILSAGLANGLLSAEGAQWKVQRRALAPLFSRKAVFAFSSAMVEAARALVQRLTISDDRIIDLSVEATRTTLDVLERTIFSDGFGRDAEDIRLAMKSYFETIGQIDPLDMLGVPAAIPRPSRWRLRPMFKLFEGAIDTIITHRRGLIARGGAAAPDDILTLLLNARDPETGAALSELEIRSNILTFIAAGQETTANCITWSLFLLSQSSEWRRKVQEEVDEQFSFDADGIAERLVVTRAVIEETNRLYPPLAAISRVALGPDLLAGHPIRRGTMVVIAPYVLHRHKKLWTNPDNFDPARFFGTARAHVGRYAYLPFGAGPRVCIGATFAIQEAIIVVGALVRHFEFELAPGHQVWPMQKLTLRPQGGLPMILKRRRAT